MPITLPGSNAVFSWKQTRDLFVALDGHPEAHPATIAGRSPTYIVRELNEFQRGGRSGGASAPMK
jgi:hypothetical protein